MPHSRRSSAPAGGPYGEAFYDAVDAGSRRAAEIVAPALLELAPARATVDLGCGHGVWLRVLKDLGVERVLGIDGDYVERDRLHIDSEEFVAADLERPVSIDGTFDLAISLETAEHLAPSRSDSFVADLCRLAPIVFFSAAVPHQGGTNHVNEQPQSAWAARFARHGYRPADVLRRRFWSDLEAGVVYSQNALLYVGEHAMTDSALRAAVESTDLRMLDVVHPQVLAQHDSLRDPAQAAIKNVLKAIPYALKCSLARRRGG